MPIEFRCPQCEKLLRTPDGTAGRQAKCPQCGALTTIPETSTAAPAAATPFAGLGEMSPPAAPNPYQSPTVDQMRAAAEGPIAGRGFQPTRIEMGETITRTWQLFKTNLGTLIVGAIIMGACNFGLSIVLNTGFNVVAQSADNSAVAVAMFVVQQIVAQAIGAFFYIGMILFTLRVARGEQADYGLLFSGGPYLINGICVQILLALVVMGGFLLLIIPGIIFALMFSQSLYMLVDQNVGIIDSFKLSMAATRGNKLTIFAIYLLTGVAAMLFTLLTCFIGGIFAWPFMTLLPTVIYLCVTGQQTALDAQARSVERGFSPA